MYFSARDAQKILYVQVDQQGASTILFYDEFMLRSARPPFLVDQTCFLVVAANPFYIARDLGKKGGNSPIFAPPPRPLIYVYLFTSA